jgi:hypothetical protein
MTWWRHSRLRFYILNALWNYKFWLFAEKIFKMHTYDVIDDRDLTLEDVDITGKINFKKKRVTKRRFVGYMYKGIMYLDNPGFKHTVDNETWNAWKSKGLVK